MFVNYLKDQTPLEERIQTLFNELGVSVENRQAVGSFMAPLRDKGPVYRFHYDHSLRVALLCVEVARFVPGLDPKALFFAGLLHDVGKVSVPFTTLGKKNGWTAKDTALMKPHVMRGYEMIRGRFDFAAEIMLWHHRFQRDSYPGKIPEPLHDYCLGTKVMIPHYGRILSLCDQYDAFHRVNDKSGELTVPNGEDIMLLMRQLNPDRVLLIHELYKAEIFTLYTEPVEVSV